MTKDVLLSLIGIQYIQGQGDPEPVETLAPATYYYKNGKHYVIYDEITEGFKEKTHNIMKFNEAGLSVKKSGLIDVEMIFDPEHRSSALYQNPMGSMEMGITVRKFDLKETEDQIDLHIDYSLALDAEFEAPCQIFLKLRSKK